MLLILLTKDKMSQNKRINKREDVSYVNASGPKLLSFAWSQRYHFNSASVTIPVQSAEELQYRCPMSHHQAWYPVYD